MGSRFVLDCFPLLCVVGDNLLWLLQVLGLTSYSHWPEASRLRECVRMYPVMRQRLQQIAVGRVKSMLHVGLMEELHLSISSLAVRAAVGSMTAP